jgi:hypothetical protein
VLQGATKSPKNVVSVRRLKAETVGSIPKVTASPLPGPCEMLPLVHGRVAVLCWYGSRHTVTGTAPSFRIQDRDAATRIDRYRAVNCQWRLAIVSLGTDRRPPLAPTSSVELHREPVGRATASAVHCRCRCQLPELPRDGLRNDPPPIPATCLYPRTRDPRLVWTRNGNRPDQIFVAEK